jgi:hypothetical protein
MGRGARASRSLARAHLKPQRGARTSARFAAARGRQTAGARSAAAATGAMRRPPSPRLAPEPVEKEWRKKARTKR